MEQFNSLKNKTILITGTSRGIGRSLAEAFIKNGSKIIGISKKKNTNKVINNKNYKHYFCDLAKTEEIYKTLDLINKKFKSLDVLINNAGITKESVDSVKKNIDYFDETLKINLTAAYLFSMLSVKKMKKNRNGGTIINISSISGELGFPNNPAHVSSKSALVGLTRSFARDYGKMKINCNAILPGYFKTDMNRKSLNNSKKKKQRENLTMLGRWGEIEELVGTVLFLSSKSARYITGQKIIIDGGIVAKGL